MADMPDMPAIPDPGQQQGPAPAAPPVTQNSGTGVQWNTPASTTPPADPVMEEAGKQGGVLGQVAIGALKGAHEAANGAPAPAATSGIQWNQPTTGVQWDATPHLPEPSFLDKAKNFAKEALNYTGTGLGDVLATGGTGIGLPDVHEAAGKIKDWADKQTAPTSQPMSPFKTLATGVLRDTAGLAEGATSPEGVALTAAQFVPVLNVAVDSSLAGRGLYNMTQGWGDVHNLDQVLDKIQNPDFLQEKLNEAAQVAGSVAGASEGAIRLAQIRAAKRFGTWKDTQYEDFKNAVPPSKSANYSEPDYQVARVYMDKANAAGHPIDGSAQSVVEALDSQITANEAKLAKVIDATPNVVIPTNPIVDVQAALSGSIRKTFLAEGLKALEDYPLGVDDPPLTLRRADDIRHQLNQDNLSAMKGKNNYDYANLMQTDPAFAARNAAAESLREGLYNTLDKMGVEDSASIRTDEGAMIKVRNAALRQLNKEQTAVKASVKPAGKVKKMVAKGVKTGGAALGALGGAATGIPGAAEVGAGLGSLSGGAAAEAIEHATPLTREQLIQRSFEKPQQTNPTLVGPPLPISRNVAPGAAAVAGHESSEEQERGPRSPDLEYHHDYVTNSRGEVVHNPQ